MNPLFVPYVFNVVVLVPIGLMTLLGERGGQLACQGKFPESEGFRTILGSLWTAILIGSLLGLFFPVPMSPLLLIHRCYVANEQRKAREQQAAEDGTTPTARLLTFIHGGHCQKPRYQLTEFAMNSEWSHARQTGQ